MTILIVVSPHARGLAILLVIAISTALSARNGILVRDRLALEAARNLDVVVFDKTGTLTKGERGLVAIATGNGLAEDEAFALTAAIEGDSEHNIARALVEAAAERRLQLPAVQDVEALPGRGVQALVNERILMVGGPQLTEQERIVIGLELAQQARARGEVSRNQGAVAEVLKRPAAGAA